MPDPPIWRSRKSFERKRPGGYVDYLNKLLPLVRPGGLVLAHSVNMVPDYVKAVTSNADLETVFYAQGAGLAVTLKKR